jgi:hypothetical protein
MRLDFLAGFPLQRRVSGEPKPLIMKSLRNTLLQFSLCAGLACQLLAQTATPLPPVATPAPATTPSATTTGELKEKRFSVQFNNTKLEPVMDIIRAQLPDLNIVVPPSLADAPVGPLKLRNINVEGLIRAIEAATDGRIHGEFDGDAYLSFSATQNVPQPESVCRVLSLQRYLTGKKGDEVKRAIEDLNEVVAMARDHLENARNGIQLKAPEFSVHPSTKLLIVVGSPESVAIVEEVVNAVSGGANTGIPAGFFPRRRWSSSWNQSIWFRRRRSPFGFPAAIPSCAAAART